MSESQIDIKIGCTGSQKEQEYSELSASLTLQQAKINEYNKNIQKCINSKKTPLLALELDLSEEIEMETSVELFGGEFQLSHKVVGKKMYLYGDLKNQQRMLFLKKIERVFHLMTQLKIEANAKFSIHQAEKKIHKEKPSILELLNGIKIKGNLKMDEKADQILKKCLVKASPKFMESPIFIFLELFIAVNFKLDLESLEFLESEARDQLVSLFFKANSHNTQLYQLLKKLQAKPAKLSLCLQKLILLQLEAPSEILALICIFL